MLPEVVQDDVRFVDVKVLVDLLERPLSLRKRRKRLGVEECGLDCRNLGFEREARAGYLVELLLYFFLPSKGSGCSSWGREGETSRPASSQ